MHILKSTAYVYLIGGIIYTNDNMKKPNQQPDSDKLVSFQGDG